MLMFSGRVGRRAARWCASVSQVNERLFVRRHSSSPLIAVVSGRVDGVFERARVRTNFDVFASHFEYCAAVAVTAARIAVAVAAAFTAAASACARTRLFGARIGG